MKTGKLVALRGIVGCGKTTLLRRIRNTLAQDNAILVSQSLSVDKSQLTLPVLIDALFYDLETRTLRIPRQLQRREQSITSSSWIAHAKALLRTEVALNLDLLTFDDFIQTSQPQLF
jgi:type II secretory pathway predicted ATPase ExeA